MDNMALTILNGRKQTAVIPINLAELKEQYSEIAKAREEVGGSPCLRVKIPSGGGISFEIDSGEESVSVQVFKGLIIGNHKVNACWDETGENVNLNLPPICSSMDGLFGVDSEGEVNNCKNCPSNEYGSAEKGNGKGKACKNMHRLYIMIEETAIPLVLTLPPTSLKNWQTYRLNVLASRGLKPHRAITEISLEAATNSNGIKYNTVKFKLLGKIPEETIQIADFFNSEAIPKPDITRKDYDITE
ncbi:MAG: hypothetical protein K0S55_280 [Clostridia bacterium]|nr:hypothetical protein [Clostridia bacterium]